ncbi:hypothetical protein VTK26DRAFT_5326 [Humicola hyalothermophila]
MALPNDKDFNNDPNDLAFPAGPNEATTTANQSAPDPDDLEAELARSWHRQEDVQWMNEVLSPSYHKNVFDPEAVADLRSILASKADKDFASEEDEQEDEQEQEQEQEQRSSYPSPPPQRYNYSTEVIPDGAAQPKWVPPGMEKEAWEEEMQQLREALAQEKGKRKAGGASSEGGRPTLRRSPKNQKKGGRVEKKRPQQGN